MQKSTLATVATLFAISTGCDGDSGGAPDKRVEDDSSRSAFGADSGAAGACTLTCEGEVYACASTDQVGCRAGAFAHVPRCSHKFKWVAGVQCGAEPGSAVGADSGAAGTCTLTCEGEVHGCEVTDEAGCRASAFARVPRCPHELEWAAGGQCEDASSEATTAREVACDKPTTQCTGFGLAGPVDYTMNPCAPVLCAEVREGEAQAQLQYGLACEAAGGEVTECNCGLAVCSIDAGANPSEAGATPLSETQALRRDLASKYPKIAAGSTEPENKKVLCPFLRMLTRAGIFEQEEKRSELKVGILKVALAAREFACSLAACGSVAAVTSQNQVFSKTTKVGAVNLESLHTAGSLSHDCGLTFAKGGSEVDDSVRDQTLRSLRDRADEKGRLTLDDITAVKQGICDARGVSNTRGGRIEVGLIYTFLGGNERGFVDYADVKRLLSAELPKTIGKPSSPTVPQAG